MHRKEITMNEIDQEKNQKEKVNNFLELIKKFPVIIFVIVLAFVLGFILISRVAFKKEDKVNTVKTQEKRAIFETKFFDESINKRGDAAHQNSEAKQTKVQMKHDSKIEVFIQTDGGRSEGENRGNESGRKEIMKLGLSAGTLIPARVQGTIFSFNTKAPVICAVTKDIEKDGKILIPKDSRFLGEADVIKSINRINVSFHLLIFPDGREMKVRAMAVSADTSAGIKGRIDKHHDQRALKAVGETLLAGASLFTAGFPSAEPYSLQDELRMNLAQNLTQEAAQDLRTEKIDSSITVENFTPIQVLLLDGI